MCSVLSSTNKQITWALCYDDSDSIRLTIIYLVVTDNVNKWAPALSVGVFCIEPPEHPINSVQERQNILENGSIVGFANKALLLFSETMAILAPCFRMSVKMAGTSLYSQ